MSTVSMGHAAWQAEILKLRKRPTTWALAGILLVPVVVFEYLFSYRLIASGADLPDTDALITRLLPNAFVGTTLMQLVSPVGAGIALILATVAVGSEYSWRTWRTTATQRPGRGTLLSGKLLAITTTLGVVAAITLGAGWIASLTVAALLDAPQAGPPLLTIIAGWAAAWPEFRSS